MNLLLLSHELGALLLGVALLLIDLWLPARDKRHLGYVAAAGVAALLVFSLKAFGICGDDARFAFNSLYVLDPMALFFKRFFLVAAAIVLVMSVEYADRIEAGISEYYALILFALTGMMFAASANDFSMLFVSLELVTITFYILVAFLRGRVLSIEAGIKYLIMGALSSAFLVFGIALVYAASGHLGFEPLHSASVAMAGSHVFQFGVLLILSGVGFKLSMVPFQMWAPDVYQGAPAPTTAFLATGSKAVGLVLFLRLWFCVAPVVAAHLNGLLMILAGLTILYGNLCAIPQRDVKRLLGYSGIAHAGYLLLGVTAMSDEGSAAVLFYVAGYLFTVLAAFSVISVVMRNVESSDVRDLAGLNQRSPLLASALTIGLMSLAGLPPMAGFFGKFLLIKSILVQGGANPACYWLAGVAIFGVVVSIYYYMRIVRAVYFPGDRPATLEPIRISAPMFCSLVLCMGAIFVIGLMPSALLRLADLVVATMQ